VETGVQEIGKALKTLDSGFRRNDRKGYFQTFCEIIKFDFHTYFLIPPLTSPLSQGLESAPLEINVFDESYQARAARAQTMPHWNWLAVNEARHKMRLRRADFFRKCDLLLCPTATTPAFPHNQKGERWERMVMVNGKPQPSTTQMFRAGYSGNFCLPSPVAPAGLASNGLPVRVQIIGPQYGDLTCIHFAHLLEQEFQGFVPPPGYE
jgi:Asp-tRNA(Asn)/Glu-tRNA(Gln) amidotransferase A subunit family amidase